MLEMRMIMRQWLLLFVLLGVVSGAAADEREAAQQKAHEINTACFSCHAPAALKNPPRPDLNLNALKKNLQSPERFVEGDHGRLACTKCHNEGYDAFPHTEDAKESTSTCSDCHSKIAMRIEKQFEKSVHASLGEAFTCTTCHNPHEMRVAHQQRDASKIVAQDNRICLNCHDSDEAFKRFSPEKKIRPAIDDIHAWLPNARLHWKAVRCVECHTPLVERTEGLSHEILNKSKAERSCVACHSQDSSLKTRLYRHLIQEEQQRMGFVNSVILSNTYVLGATRHPVIDACVIIAFVVMIAGLLLHGLGRILFAFLRRKKK